MPLNLAISQVVSQEAAKAGKALVTPAPQDQPVQLAQVAPTTSGGRQSQQQTTGDKIMAAARATVVMRCENAMEAQMDLIDAGRAPKSSLNGKLALEFMDKADSFVYTGKPEIKECPLPGVEFDVNKEVGILFKSFTDKVEGRTRN